MDTKKCNTYMYSEIVEETVQKQFYTTMLDGTILK